MSNPNETITEIKLGGWIQVAIHNGGHLVVYRVSPEIWHAEMSWPDNREKLCSNQAALQDALDGVNDGLQEDAAEEMREAGTV